LDRSGQVLLAKYELTRMLGKGGMGEVWEGEHQLTGRRVAVKVLSDAYLSNKKVVARFGREARAASAVQHDGIVEILDQDRTADGVPFLVMEFLAGESVGQRLKRKKQLSESEALAIMLPLLDALDAAHQAGVIHRDLKPDNVFILPGVRGEERIKILDFGISQKADEIEHRLTQEGSVLGTPHYMSPEQALGRTVDARTDIFSLGVVLYEMLSGTKPFAGEAVTEILLQIVMAQPRDIAQAAFGITPALAKIVRRCMQKQPDDRFQSCDELRAALAESLKEDPSALRKSSVPTIAARKETAPPPPPPPRASTPHGRALIADDDPATRYILAGVLAKHQIACDEAANGADAIKLLKSNDYALIFIDLLMPRIDGWGVIDYLRTHRSRAKTFVVTGVQNQKLSTADQDVVSGLLFKPLDVNQVERLVAG
jgi:serine/threonine protein kinase